MATPAAERLITAEEFEHMPEARDHELIDGRLVPMMAAGFEHGQYSRRLGARLGDFVDEHRLGGLATNDPGFYLRRNPDRVQAPDIAFIPRARLPADEVPRGFTTLVPALVVEVISPNDLDENVQERVAEFLVFGVDRIWLVRPATRTVEVIRAGGDAHIYGEDDTLTSDDAAFGVEGFELPIAAIFA